MRGFTSLAVLVAGALAPGPSAVASFEVPVQGGEAYRQAPSPTQRPPRIQCSGVAPTHPYCTGSMTIDGPFTIHMGWEIGYQGYFYVRGSSDTGSTTIWCDFLFSGPPCEVTYEGHYEVGQTWTMYVLAAGRGYWSVAVRDK